MLLKPSSAPQAYPCGAFSLCWPAPNRAAGSGGGSELPELLLRIYHPSGTRPDVISSSELCSCQHAMEPSVRMPHIVESPASRCVKVPGGW